MARITIEDCLKNVPNRFQLTLAATYRARQLLQGHTPKVEAKDKPTVVALREIAAGITIFSQKKPSGGLWSRVAGDALDVAGDSQRGVRGGGA